MKGQNSSGKTDKTIGGFNPVAQIYQLLQWGTVLISKRVPFFWNPPLSLTTFCVSGTNSYLRRDEQHLNVSRQTWLLLMFLYFVITSACLTVFFWYP